jgi:mannose-1-phosphate guanylyltransferase
MCFVIMAGGSGTRFWPVSRQNYPKQFLAITGKDPMVVETYARIRPMAKDDSEIFVVVGNQHAEITRQLFAGTKVNIVVEPVGRNTAPCIGLSSILAKINGFNEAMAILPSDHFVSLPEVFRKDLSTALDLANQFDCIVTLGIIPTRPETGYGYIEIAGEKMAEMGKPVPVKGFKEKPDTVTAESYVASGRYLWNAGIFVAKPSIILDELSHSLPEFCQGLQKLENAANSQDFESCLVSLYQSAPNISFDYAVMERARVPLFVVPSSCGWSDVGSWLSLYELKAPQKASPAGNVSEGEAHFIDAKENFVYSTNSRAVVLLGLSRILVVDTQDALLVANIDRHQEIRCITDYLARIGRNDLL